MSTAVSFLKKYHAAPTSTAQVKVAKSYRSLSENQIQALAEYAIDSHSPETFDTTDQILVCLACFQSGSLTEHHEHMLDADFRYPGVIYHGACDSVARRLIDSISEDAKPHQWLRVLAWIGSPVVQRAFHSWRESPPPWAKALRNAQPHDYAKEAGWELISDGSRRDLFQQTCHPLLKSRSKRTDAAAVSVLVEHEDNCQWCERAMTTFVDLDLTNPLLDFFGVNGSRLRMTACDHCVCFSRAFFTEVDLEGKSQWHDTNKKPSRLPDATRAERYTPNGLRLGQAKRSCLESASWILPGVSFSQIGGYPTWIAGTAYPPCPQCEESMPFLGQISNEDVEEYAEGIYYMFLCKDCGVAATSYQQS